MVDEDDNDMQYEDGYRLMTMAKEELQGAWAPVLDALTHARCKRRSNQYSPTYFYPWKGEVRELVSRIGDWVTEAVEGEDLQKSADELRGLAQAWRSSWRQLIAWSEAGPGGLEAVATSEVLPINTVEAHDGTEFQPLLNALVRSCDGVRLVLEGYKRYASCGDDGLSDVRTFVGAVGGVMTDYLELQGGWGGLGGIGSHLQSRLDAAKAQGEGSTVSTASVAGDTGGETSALGAARDATEAPAHAAAAARAETPVSGAAAEAEGRELAAADEGAAAAAAPAAAAAAASNVAPVPGAAAEAEDTVLAAADEGAAAAACDHVASVCAPGGGEGVGTPASGTQVPPQGAALLLTDIEVINLFMDAYDELATGRTGLFGWNSTWGKGADRPKTIKEIVTNIIGSGHNVMRTGRRSAQALDTFRLWARRDLIAQYAQWGSHTRSCMLFREIVTGIQVPELQVEAAPSAAAGGEAGPYETASRELSDHKSGGAAEIQDLESKRNVSEPELAGHDSRQPAYSTVLKAGLLAMRDDTYIMELIAWDLGVQARVRTSSDMNAYKAMHRLMGRGCDRDNAAAKECCADTVITALEVKGSLPTSEQCKHMEMMLQVLLKCVLAPVEDQRANYREGAPSRAIKLLVTAGMSLEAVEAQRCVHGAQPPSAGRRGGAAGKLPAVDEERAPHEEAHAGHDSGAGENGRPPVGTCGNDGRHGFGG